MRSSITYLLVLKETIITEQGCPAMVITNILIVGSTGGMLCHYKQTKLYYITMNLILTTP